METTTFTDCVNCLIAYTNNPHSLDVSLNAIAFLRFCAMKLAEGEWVAAGSAVLLCLLLAACGASITSRQSLWAAACKATSVHQQQHMLVLFLAGGSRAHQLPML